MMSSLKQGHFFLASHVKTVVITNQRLMELGADVFAGAPQLEDLKLDNNEISNLDENVFRNLTSLKNLTISSNEIEALPEEVFSTLEDLEILDLSSNLLAVIPYNIFNGNRFLNDINLSHNRILFLATFQLFDSVNYDLIDNFCVGDFFERTSKLNEFTNAHCNSSTILDPFSVSQSFREQEAINKVCKSKDTLGTLQAALEALTTERDRLLGTMEDVEVEIMKEKIYKNSLC